MLFYQVDVVCEPTDLPESGKTPGEKMRLRDDFDTRASSLERRLSRESGKKRSLAIIDQNMNKFEVALVCTEPNAWENIIRNYFEQLDVRITELSATEVTLSDTEDALRSASTAYSFPLKRPNRWEPLGIAALSAKAYGFFSSETLSEHMIPDLSQADIKKMAISLNMPSLDAELQRIEETTLSSEAGRPAEYLIETSDLTSFQETLKPLLSAQYQKGWLYSHRYTLIEGLNLQSFNPAKWNQLFYSAIGGTLILEPRSPIQGSSPALTQLSELIEEYQKKVLVIFKLPLGSKVTKSAIRTAMPGQLFVSIDRPPLTKAEATTYAIRQAEMEGLKPDDSLNEHLNMLEYPTNFDALKYELSSWRGKTLRSRYYPAYAAIEVEQPLTKLDETKNDALEELNQLIGLTEVKALLAKVISSFKMNQLRKEPQFTIQVQHPDD